MAPQARDHRGRAVRFALRWAPSVGEIVVALTATVLFTVWATTLGGNPLLRVQQVSALGALQLRFTLLALVILGLVAWWALRGVRRGWGLLIRFACAAAAGLTGGFIGAGETWALHGTPWGINGQSGDNGRMIQWAQQVITTGHFDNIYPPGFPHLAAFVAQTWYHNNVAMAYKPLLIFILALTAPLVYLAWRMVLAPLPSAGIAVLGALSGAVPVKPWTPIVCMLLVPVFAKLAQWLRGSPAFSWWGAGLRGIWLGVLCALLFLGYSGWHVWSAPGVLVLVLCVFPWRRGGNAGRLRGLTLLLGFALGFLPLAWSYLIQMLGATATKDLYCGTYALQDPGSTIFSYSLMGSPWPLLLLGVGLSVWLGLRLPAVATALLFFAGTWLMRFAFASRMATDGNIRLFPHTGIELQYLLVIMLVLGVTLLAGRASQLFAGKRTGTLAALVVLFLLCGVGASAIADGVMPISPSSNKGGSGSATWAAQQLRRQDNGKCPTYAVNGSCTTMPLTPSLPAFDSSGPLVCPAYGYNSGGDPVTKP